MAIVLSLLLGAQIAGATDPSSLGADEPIAVSDAVSVTPPADTAATEGVSVLDTAGVFPSTSAGAQESVAVADSADVKPPAETGSSDSLTVGDSVGVFPAVSQTVDEATHVSDAASVVPSPVASSAESVAVGDSVGVFPPVSPTVDEATHVSDAASVVPSPVASSAESVAVGDSVGVFPPVSHTVDEATYVSDAAYVVPSPVVAVQETTSVADSVSVEALLFPTQTTLVAATEPLLRGGAETVVAIVTAGGSPVTSGAVTLKDAGVVIAGPMQVDATGRASFVVNSLALGAHVLTASFEGAPVFLASNGSAAVDVYDYALSLSPSAQTVQRGAGVSYTLTAALVPGSSTGRSTATLPLSVSGAPAGATTSFSGPLSLPALGTTTLQLATTLATTAGDATLVVAGDGGARTASAHLYVNAPPTVRAGGPYTVAEGSTVVLIGTATDVDHDTLTAAWDLNGDGTFETAGLTPSFRGIDGPASVPVQLRVCDDHGACATATTTVTVTNVAPTVRITAPADGTIVPVGTPVSFTGSFTDPGTLDTQTAAWNFGATGLSATHTFTAAGFPTVTLIVTDKDGGVGTASIRLVVVDTRAGSVSGEGWIRTAAGRTTFEFEAKYEDGGRLKGDVDLKTPVGKFHAKSLRYLVVTGSTFELDGTGTLAGVGGVSFHLSGIDGRPDRLRVQIGAVYDSGGPLELGDGKLKIHS